ncbi:partial Asparagine--tRNA ligase, partial [Geobacteraceae bacterium]
MSARIRIRSALAGEGLGAVITVKGWVRTTRAGKGVAFLALNDGSCFANLQVVAEPGLANFEDVCAMGTGAAVAVRGR